MLKSTSLRIILAAFGNGMFARQGRGSRQDCDAKLAALGADGKSARGGLRSVKSDLLVSPFMIMQRIQSERLVPHFARFMGLYFRSEGLSLRLQEGFAKLRWCGHRNQLDAIEERHAAHIEEAAAALGCANYEAGIGGAAVFDNLAVTKSHVLQGVDASTGQILHATVQIVCELNVGEHFGGTNYDVAQWLCVTKTSRDESIEAFSLFGHAVPNLDAGTHAVNVTVADKDWARCGIMIPATASKPVLVRAGDPGAATSDKDRFCVTFTDSNGIEHSVVFEALGSLADVLKTVPERGHLSNEVASSSGVMHSDVAPLLRPRLPDAAAPPPVDARALASTLEVATATVHIELLELVRTVIRLKVPGVPDGLKVKQTLDAAKFYKDLTERANPYDTTPTPHIVLPISPHIEQTT